MDNIVAFIYSGFLLLYGGSHIADALYRYRHHREECTEFPLFATGIILAVLVTTMGVCIVFILLS